MKNKKSKKLLIVIICLVLAAAIGGGVFFAVQSGGETVGVFSFDYVGMTEYWGDSQESYGPVTTDRIQTVFLSDTQTVTEVLVKEGDQVKKGDTLMTFDTTLSDLQLERKRLEVEKLKLQLDEANATLKKIRNMVPMEPLGPDDLLMEEPDRFLGAELTESYKAYIVEGHDGTSLEKAFICRIRDDKYIDNALLEDLRQAVWGSEGICEHNVWAEKCDLCNYCEHNYPIAECPFCNCTHGEDCEICNECVHGIIEAECDICNPEICEHKEIKDLCPECAYCIHGKILASCTLCNAAFCDHGIPGELCNVCSPVTCIHGGDCTICYCEHGFLRKECPTCNGTEEPPAPEGISATEEDGWFIRFLANTETEETTPVGEETETEGSVFSYFVIFKTTEKNMELGNITQWKGVHVVGQGESFNLSFFDPITEDYSLPELEEEEVPAPDYDFQMGYTAKQLLEMRREQEKKIKDLEFQIKVADNAYKIMLKEVNDGNIRAEFDGEVVSVLPEEEAKSARQPIVKVSGGGGFYIEGSVSELEKENLVIGQEVTVNDWNTGGTYTGKIDSIGDFPSNDNGWNGMGNPNATFFPFLVFVDGEADLQEGAYVSVQYSAAESNHGIYLEKAFLRKEKGESFVYVLGEGNRLEKRVVTTGKSLWGSYIEVLSGITPEDLIAFPYGKDVKEGAKAEERDIGSLYGY